MTPAVRCVAALCAAGVVLAAGCGDLPDEPAVKRPGQNISTREVAAQPPGSPQRALLAWMRHLQRMELTAALDEYAASVPVDPPRLLIMRTATKKQWRYIGPPEILDVDRRGSDATVYTMLQSQTRAPNGRRDISRRPYAFHLRKEDGSWKLSDNLFLVVMAQAANAPSGQAQ